MGGVESSDLTPSGAGATRASVIIDVSSLAHAIGGPKRGRADVRLESVCQVLCEAGFEPLRLRVALATEPVTTGPDSNLALARKIVRQDNEWLRRETAGSPVPVLVAPGAHNGVHEVGVDDMVVAAVLIEAAMISNDPTRVGEAVVVLTHDSDMDHLAGLVAPVPLVLVGRYDKMARKRLKRGAVSHVGLTDTQLERCGKEPLPDWTRPVDRRVEGHISVVVPGEPLPVAPTTAIVDAYGLACSAATVLGLSRLPSVGSIKHLLTTHGESGQESALLVTIPDILLEQPKEGKLQKRRRRAWRARGDQLDRLAKKLDEDGDPRTLERRAVLRPSRIPVNMADRLDRRGAVRTAKRLSTQLTADLVRSVLEDSTSRVVLITDSPHVAWVQSSLPALLGTAWGNVRVSRWGVQAAPVLVHPHGGGPRLPDADFMVITESRLAELVCLAPHVMPGPQRDVLQAAAQPDFEAAQWKVVGYDPEVDGVTVRNDDLPGRELTLAGGLALGLEVGSTLEGIGPGVELRFEPSSPSAMPVLAGINAPHGVPATHLEVVEIVDRSGTLIRFDIDGDGRADVEIDVLHDLRPVRPDASATLGHLVIAGGSHRWAYVSSTDNAAARMPQVVEVLSSSANGMIVAGHASHAASHGELLPPPGSPPVSLRAGDMVWAIDVSAEGESATWITLSTPLRTPDDGHDHPEQAAEADDNAR